MPRKQRLKDEDGENVELPSGLLPSKRIARKPRKQRLKDEDEEEDDELPSGLLPNANFLAAFPQISEVDCPLLKLDLRAEHGRPVFSRG